MGTGRARQREKSTVTDNGIHIRWMIRRDMPEVMRAERASFEYSWTEDDFLRCLRQRNCIGMVVEQGDRIGGFMIYELHKTRLHLLNFAVHPSVRRTGLGKLMVGKLVYKMTSHRRQKITLAVRERNLAAQMFFRAHGFQATRMLQNYYEDSGEDAYQMELMAPPYDPFDGFGVIAPVNRIAQYEES
ncbi:MAG: ribosomal protein S18-alanine N-acetyltransferase [Planctomycetes bacterium]|nr:ribosomal protein S18-alanine N-acetyltransferase [Planctomycetota bacterium]